MGRLRKLASSFFSVALVVFLSQYAGNAAAKQDIPSLVTAGGTEIVVYIYEPEGCSQTDILMVFHGLNRKAASLLSKSTDFANAACMTVFSPLLDKKRFPQWRYQRAGVVNDGKVQPEENWTVVVVRDLIDYALARVKSSNPRVYLFGHSAGAQFLSRLVAYAELDDIERIVIANPSAYTEPDKEAVPPYGFNGVYSGEALEHRIRAYLASPVTVYLGVMDTGDRYLLKEPGAVAQGENRLQRGRNVFQRAQAVARENGWVFNWKLVEVPEVGHSSGGMLRASELFDAMGVSREALVERVH